MDKYKQQLQGLCCVEISGESCANCLTLMPILKDLCDAFNAFTILNSVRNDMELYIRFEKEDAIQPLPSLLLHCLLLPH